MGWTYGTPEDFTDGWVETDAGTYVSQDSTSVTLASNSPIVSDNRVVKDFGADYFGTSTRCRFEITITGMDASTNFNYICYMSNNANAGDENDANNPGFSLRVNNGSGSPSNRSFYLIVFDGSVVQLSGSEPALSTTYYCELIREGGTVTANVYTDSGYSSLLGTANTSITSTHTFQYMAAISSFHGGGGGVAGGVTSNLTFGTEDTVSYDEGDGLRIYYSGSAYPNYYVDCWCKRWDEGNWDLTVETFLPSGARNALFANLVPGAVREMYNILGTPKYIDTTYTSGNTLIIEPLSGSGVSGLRERRTVAVKSINDTFINKEYFNVKIEGKRIDI